MKLSYALLLALFLFTAGYGAGVWNTRRSDNKITATTLTTQNDKINAVTITEKVKQRHKDGATTERVVTTRTEQKTSAEKTRKENVSEKAPKVDMSYKWRVGVEWHPETRRADAMSISYEILPRVDIMLRVDKEKRPTIGVGVRW